MVSTRFVVFVIAFIMWLQRCQFVFASTNQTCTTICEAGSRYCTAHGEYLRTVRRDKAAQQNSTANALVSTIAAIAPLHFAANALSAAARIPLFNAPSVLNSPHAVGMSSMHVYVHVHVLVVCVCMCCVFCVCVSRTGVFCVCVLFGMFVLVCDGCVCSM